MIYHKNEEIHSLIEKFEDSTATAAEWTHAAHLTAALWYAVHHDFDAAFDKMRAGIFKLNEAHGTPNTPTRGYHETLTVFWMKIVWNYKDKNEHLSLVEMANNLIKDCDSKLPLKFYSHEVLFSPAARARYIEPNLQNHI
jgi:hypothetical protein